MDIVNDEETAKDIVSEVFTDLWEDLPERQQINLEAYLYTTVRNRSIDHLRHLTVARQYERIFLQEEQEWEETNEEQEEKIKRIYTVMGTLTPKTRRIFEQCYFKGRKYLDVAEEMGISVAAVHKHIVKAFATLRKEILGNSK